jgi:hypothetical protein
MATLEQMQQALATQIQTQLSPLSGTADPLIQNLQVTHLMNVNPTPPSVDIYPAEEFQDAFTFGRGHNQLFLMVRARVTTADSAGGQSLLLTMMDPESSTSMAMAITADRTWGGVVARASVVEGPSGFGVFPQASGDGGALLGCTWRVQVTP